MGLMRCELIFLVKCVPSLFFWIWCVGPRVEVGNARVNYLIFALLVQNLLSNGYLLWSHESTELELYATLYNLMTMLNSDDVLLLLQVNLFISFILFNTYAIVHKFLCPKFYSNASFGALL